MAAGLSVLVADPARAGLLTDFDGTLAPIVEDPAAARPLPGAPEFLRRLGRQLGLVGVVSGRPVGYLVDRFGGDPTPVRLAGLYGLEEVGADGRVRIRPGSEQWAAAVDQAVAAARVDAPAGLGIEPKGLMVTFHWRRAPETEGWARSFAAVQAAGTGLVAEEGRMSVELRPPVAIDKGTVVGEWCAGLAAACFLGDDRGDLAAFAALDRLAATGGFQALKVAVASPESPGELTRGADFTVPDPAAVLELLEHLTRLLPDPDPLS